MQLYRDSEAVEPYKTRKGPAGTKRSKTERNKTDMCLTTACSPRPLNQMCKLAHLNKKQKQTTYGRRKMGIKTNKELKWFKRLNLKLASK
jgi:hypothetical protein